MLNVLLLNKLINNYQNGLFKSKQFFNQCFQSKFLFLMLDICEENNHKDFFYNFKHIMYTMFNLLKKVPYFDMIIKKLCGIMKYTYRRFTLFQHNYIEVKFPAVISSTVFIGK